MALLSMLSPTIVNTFKFQSPSRFWQLTLLERYQQDRLEDREKLLQRDLLSQQPMCSCMRPNKTEYLDDYDRRVQEAVWMEREKERKPLTLCKGLSPLNYIGDGISVERLKTVHIVGLSIEPAIFALVGVEHVDLTLTLRSVRNLGTLSIHTFDDKMALLSTIGVSGNGTTEILITLSRETTAESINTVLNNVWYDSTTYILDSWERLEVSFLNFAALINIHIKRDPLPDLYDTHSGSVADKVTVITKTFERYSAVHRLIDSVHSFYPELQIIVADDSENPSIIKRNFVKHYTMPFFEGYFAGRNLALSQVRTKYVLYVDDDMFFTKDTKLERMIRKLEDQDVKIDIVASAVQGFPSSAAVFDIAYGKEGVCILGINGSVSIPVSKYPQCLWGEWFYNFFLGKTDVIRQIGFDPDGIKNRGHTEFWLDALGKSQSAFCSDVEIGHDNEHIHVSTKYTKYRNEHRQNTHMLFQNNLCYYFYHPSKFFDQGLA
ncbi:beta-1,4 N-acetylgalactosaminyltransferase 1-like [Glandiceps talaboti]